MELLRGEMRLRCFALVGFGALITQREDSHVCDVEERGMNRGVVD